MQVTKVETNMRVQNQSVIRQALADILPLCLLYVPFALVMGLTVVDSGIDPFLGWSSSWLIYGGAAQLTLISLLGAGTSVIAAISAALVVNARHLLYSAALAPRFQDQPRWMQLMGPYLMVDQAFALSSLRSGYSPKDFRTYYLTVGIISWANWQITTGIGLLVGPMVPSSWQLHFAVPILFLGMVVMGIDRSSKLVAALVGAGVTVLCADLPNRSGLLVGALAGIVTGTVIERCRQ